VRGDRRRLPAAALAGVLAAGVLAALGTSPAHGETGYDPDGRRLMLLGDSVTHGSAGDWTWRYRLWHHLQATGAADVDLVGPSRALHEESAAYADPAFDRDHASRWGNRLVLPMYDVGDLAAEHDPDVVVVLLGYNDLTWFKRTPAQVAADMGETVAELRAEAPGVDVVVSRLPHTRTKGVEATNELFSALAAELDSAEERVVVAHADAGFRQSTADDVQDTYDPAHPTSRGELKIAAAVADALAALGMGAPWARPLATLPLGPREPARLSVRAGDGTATLRWSSSPGTTGHLVRRRDLTSRGGWSTVGDVGPEGVLRVDGLRNAHRYRFELTPRKGWARATDVRATETVVPRAPKPGRVPGRPRVRLVRGGSTGVAVVSWATARRATGYQVVRRDVRSGRVAVRGARGTRLRVTGLRPGRTYAFRVRAVNDGTPGPSSNPARVTTRR
jgi:hypothetical protein